MRFLVVVIVATALTECARVRLALFLSRATRVRSVCTSLLPDSRELATMFSRETYFRPVVTRKGSMRALFVAAMALQKSGRECLTACLCRRPPLSGRKQLRPRSFPGLRKPGRTICNWVERHPKFR